MTSRRIPHHTDLISPCSCVAVFLWQAMRELANVSVDMPQISGELGIKVGPNDINPWHLEIITEKKHRGITFEEVERRIPIVLEEHHSALIFKQLKMNKIPFEMYDDEAQRLIKIQCVLGIGFDLGILEPNNQGLLHLARIISSNSLYATLRDATPDTGWREYDLMWDDLGQSSLQIGDGFWIVSNRSKWKMRSRR